MSDYELVYGPYVETEAEHHQKAAHTPVSTLRQRWDWQIVPDAENEAIAGLSDPDDKDKPVLAAAIAARATRGVRYVRCAHRLEDALASHDRPVHHLPGRQRFIGDHPSRARQTRWMMSAARDAAASME